MGYGIWNIYENLISFQKRGLLRWKVGFPHVPVSFGKWAQSKNMPARDPKLCGGGWKWEKDTVA